METGKHYIPTTSDENIGGIKTTTEKKKKCPHSTANEHERNILRATILGLRF